MNKQLVNLISEMVKIDQGLRKNISPDKDMGNFLIYCVDSIHNFRIKEIIKKYGYPSQRMIGQEGMKYFWLLVQHQDFDLDLQKNCLKRCSFEPKYKAYLTDRILVNEGKEQIFGTHFDKPIKDERDVDKRRKKVGLEPLKDYLAKRK